MISDSENPAVMIEVCNRQNLFPVDKDWFVSLARRVLNHFEVQNALISVQFVDNPTMASLNWDHLQHEGPTDIITFPMSDPNDACLEGELVISVPWAEAVATANGDQLQDELNLYLIHGILHLLGEDDIDVDAAAQMRSRELATLQALNLPVPHARFELSGS